MLLLFLLSNTEYLSHNAAEYLNDDASLPSADNIFEARIDFHTSDKEKQKCFTLLTDVLIPAVAGLLVWTLEMRTTQTMSAKGTVHGRSDQWVVTETDMSFALTVWESIHEVVLQTWKLQPQDHSGGPTPRIKAKYTIPDSGRTENGGWSDEGIETFECYTGLEREARNNDDALAGEQAALDWCVLLSFFCGHLNSKL